MVTLKVPYPERGPIFMPTNHVVAGRAANFINRVVKAAAEFIDKYPVFCLGGTTEQQYSSKWGGNLQ